MAIRMTKLKTSFNSQISISSILNEVTFHDIPIYTEEGIFVWNKMVNNIIKSFDKYKGFIYPAFIEGFYRLGLDKFSIPDINLINQKLAPIGWRALYVTGFVPAGTYALMLASQIFPITASLRPWKYFDYSAAPDLAHDVLGHLPMLFVKDFRELLKKWAQKASQCEISPLDEETYKLTAALIKEKEEEQPNQNKIKDLNQALHDIYSQLNAHPSSLSILAKFYGWSFEFGIIKVNGYPNIFGAAIISSTKETQNVCEGKAELLEFNEETLQTGVNYTSPQETFFYVSNFETYNHYLNNILIKKNESQF